ncbi:MAG: hypothetical protein KIS92_15715 [Planctomycetota bacterium]|nr:hypothetical protein [Planctomycetota bacterium]
MEHVWWMIPTGGFLGIGGLYVRDYLRKHPPTSVMRPPFPALPRIALVGLGLAVLYVLVVSSFGGRCGCSRRVSSANNLSQIGKALMLYADASSTGAYPPAEGPAALIQRLYPAIMKDPRVFLDPLEHLEVPAVPVFRTDGSVDPAWAEAAGYVYLGPGNPSSTLAIMAFERHAHSGGRNVLCADGTVEWMHETAFRQALRESKPEFTPEP